ncbi:MAG: BatA domain-containing protein [Planctomycetaceae bacterium]|nr:BatA domain-containing protein [Planctomycetaceae bacterium]
MFELLTPLFAVAGGILAGVPLLLHMLRRTPAKRMPFSIVRFLTPSLPNTTKRSTIEHWPLMLLRMLAIALIALAFARPFQRVALDKTALSDRSERIAILLDASASMRRDGIREAVASEVRQATANLEPQDQLSVSVFSETLRTLVTVDEWKATEPANRPGLIDRAIEDYEPDWLSTRTAYAMLESAEEVSRDVGTIASGNIGRVILITDFQQGSTLDELRSGKWPDSVKLDLHIVRPLQSGNAGLSLVEEERTGRTRVRITNSGDAALTKYLLQTFDSEGQPAGKPFTAEVGIGQRRTFSIPEPAGGIPQIAGVELLGDTHNFDNVVDLPVEEQTAIHVGHAGSVDANDSEAMRYYLQRALDGNEAEPVDVTDLLKADGLAIPPPPDVRLVFVTESIPESLALSLDAVLKRDGLVIVALKSVDMTSSLKNLLPPGLSVAEASVKDYVMLGQIDFSSPVFSTFSDARFSDFSSIRFQKYRKLTLNGEKPASVRILAAFDSKDPAILAYNHPSGGQVLIMATGWHPDDSQWALSTRFAPMIQRFVAMANPSRSAHHLYEVGQRISPAVLMGHNPWKLLRPNGELLVTTPITALPDSNNTAAVSSSSPPLTSVVLDEPGRWSLTGDNADAAESISLLVNVAVSESRTEPLPTGQLQALGMSPDIAVIRNTSGQPDATRTAQLDAAELEAGQKFWRWLLLAGLGCLALDSIVSFALEQRRRLELI